MPRPVGYGRPETQVFPDGWQEAAAAVVEKTYDCTVSIGPAGGTPAWNEAARATLAPAAAVAYAGPASITPFEGDSEQSGEVAEDVVPTQAYQVKIPHAAAGVAIGHIVSVSAAPDAMLAVERLKVVAVEKGSRRFSRILLAVDAD